MNDTPGQRILTALASLDSLLDTHRPPSFLRRNLTHILDQHQREVLRLRQNANEPPAEMIANERREAGWDFPTANMLEELLKVQRLSLNITAIQLRHPEMQLADVPSPSRRANLAGDPNWLPHPDSGRLMPCQVHVAVPDPLNPERHKYADIRHAMIQKFTTANEKPTFDIKLEEAFALELGALFRVDKLGGNGVRRWKHTSTVRYTLRIDIRCDDPDDAVDLLAQLEGTSHDTSQNADAGGDAFRIEWNNLPECPTAAQLLHIQHWRDQTPVQLAYGAEVFMGWPERWRSAGSDRARQDAQSAMRQVPTPDASDDQEDARRKPTIKYRFIDSGQVREYVVEGLSCVFHEWEHSSLERLQLHYIIHHDYLKFEFGDSPEDDTKLVSFQLNYESLRAKQDQQYEGDFCWEAPSRQPFDIAKYLDGDSSWGLSSASNVFRTKVGGGRGRRRHEPDPGLRGRKPMPTEIKDLPRPRRKRNSVPRVPDVRFFRTASKQIVEQGTVISDSDDDIDQRWLAQSQRRDLAALGLQDGERAFHELFNGHIDSERPSSDLFITDAVVRLARSHTSTLRRPSVHAAFSAKLTRLQQHSIIDKATVTYCLELTRPTHTGREDGRKARNANDDDDGRAPRLSAEAEAHRSAASYTARSSPAAAEESELVIAESPAGALATDRIEASDSSEDNNSDASNETSYAALKNRDRQQSKPPRRWIPGRGFADEAGSRPAAAAAAAVVTDDSFVSSGDSTGSSESSTGSSPESPRWASLHNKAGSASRSSPATSESLPPHRQHDADATATAAAAAAARACLCGKPITRLRDAVACSNPACAREFHLACVGMERGRRDVTWRCDTCRLST